MTATSQAEARAAELETIYRAHLAACPRRHVGILADCQQGLRLRSAVRAARRAADKGAP
ncbi:hypothetical protein [Streptomyces aureocirculatus]|uniref:hypothetical protein n=1 Tax=Streptomyces aureocirculatus TaxID=67275 RepID=UPI000A898EB9|nr:hypothetical protein [Streptomyces aureocirculatus]